MKYIPLLVMLFLSIGCITLTPKFKGDIYLHEPIPIEYCQKHPEIQEYGIYRKLNDGKEEYISYCDPEIMKYLSSYIDDVEISGK